MSGLLKIAAVVLVIVGVIYLVNAFWPESEPEPESSFYDTVAEDDRRFRAEPELSEPPEQTEAYEVEPATESQEPQQVAKKPEPVKPQFKELSLEDKVDAERLLEFAISQFEIGRLPGMGFKPMVDSCRQIIAKYPDSVYAFKAKRVLADMPERYRKRYNITTEEIDLGGLK